MSTHQPQEGDSSGDALQPLLEHQLEEVAHRASCELCRLNCKIATAWPESSATEIYLQLKQAADTMRRAGGLLAETMTGLTDTPASDPELLRVLMDKLAAYLCVVQDLETEQTFIRNMLLLQAKLGEEAANPDHLPS